MRSSAALRSWVSIEEYLALEAAATEKNFLWEGEVSSVEAMAGGTPDHGRVRRLTEVFGLSANPR